MANSGSRSTHVPAASDVSLSVTQPPHTPSQGVEAQRGLTAAALQSTGVLQTEACRPAQHHSHRVLEYQITSFLYQGIGVATQSHHPVGLRADSLPLQIQRFKRGYAL